MFWVGSRNRDDAPYSPRPREDDDRRISKTATDTGSGNSQYKPMVPRVPITRRRDWVFSRAFAKSRTNFRVTKFRKDPLSGGGGVRHFFRKLILRVRPRFRRPFRFGPFSPFAVENPLRTRQFPETLSFHDTPRFRRVGRRQKSPVRTPLDGSAYRFTRKRVGFLTDFFPPLSPRQVRGGSGRVRRPHAISDRYYYA